jgi:hypothetical protein
MSSLSRDLAAATIDEHLALARRRQVLRPRRGHTRHALAARLRRVADRLDASPYA